MNKLIKTLAFWKGIGILLSTSALMWTLWLATSSFISLEIELLTLGMIFIFDLLIRREFTDKREFENKLNSLGQTAGRNKVHIRLNLINLFILWLCSLSEGVEAGSGFKTGVVSLTRTDIWIACILALVSIVLWLSYTLQDKTWKVLFRLRDDSACCTTAKLLNIVLFYVVTLFCLKTFMTYYIWIACLPFCVFFLSLEVLCRDGNDEAIQDNALFFLVCFGPTLELSYISTVVQTWDVLLMQVPVGLLIICVSIALSFISFWYLIQKAK